MSAITVADDWAVIRANTTPVLIDVIRNDSSTAAGSLNLFSVSAPVHGTASIVPGDPAGSGTARRDRIQFVPEPGLTEPTDFEYVAVDADGNLATAVVTVTVAPGSIGSAGGSVSVGADGGLEIAGGLGGTNHQISPTGGYAPIVSGNYETGDTQTASFSRGLNVDGQTAPGSGTQDISRSVVVTESPNGDGSYSEVVTWSYAVMAVGASGGSSHISGGYSYAFSVTSVAGVQITTLALQSHDAYDVTSTTSTPTGSVTIHATGLYSYQATVTFIDNPVDPDSGLQSESSMSVSANSVSGSYTSRGLG